MATTSNTYTGNGSNKLFSITFPYLETTDIDVYLNGTLQTITTQYTFANATTIEFVTAPANGAVVLLDRSTDDSVLQATFFPGSSIKAADLNIDFDQTLYVVQEINNKAVKTNDSLYVNKTYVDAADATKVAKAGDTMSGVLAMGTNKITGVGNPTANQDVATKIYVDTTVLAAAPDGDRGDITVSSSGTVWTIDSGTVTSAKIADGAVTSAKIADGTIVNADINAAAAIQYSKLALGSSITSSDIVDGTLVNADINASAGIVATKLSFTQSGTGATARTIDAKLKDVVSAKDFGAVGDGTTDDTAAIQAALTAASSLGKSVYLPAGTYKVSTRIIVPSNTGLVSREQAKIYATAAGFNNTSLSNKYAANSCVIQLSGLIVSPFTATTNQILHGIVIESQVSDGRFVDAVVARNCTNLEISNVEIFGFPAGRAICIASSFDSTVTENYIHDCTTNANYGVSPKPQITGIEIDNDRVNSIYSQRLLITNNRIKNLTFGATALGLYGYETDGINIVGFSFGITISGNVIDTVGEGIDTFGRSCVITNNLIKNSYIFGIKLIHGASYNVVSSNHIFNTGIAGIEISGSTVTDAGDITKNIIQGNLIQNVDYLNVWGAVGDPSGIKIDNSTVTYKPVKNLISNNIIDVGTYGKYGLIMATESLGNIWDGNAIVSAPSVSYTDANGAYSVRDAKPTRYKATLDSTQSVPANVWTKINFGTAEFDARGELNAANKRWVCQVSGIYQVTAQIRTPSAGTYLIELGVRKNNVPVLQVQERINSSNDATRAVSGLVKCVAGDYLELFVLQAHTANIDITSVSELTYFCISST